MKEKIFQDLVALLEGEITTLNKEINSRSKKVKTFENLITELNSFEDFSEYKDKYEDLIGELDKEKERLMKLHNHYKKMEDECQDLRSKVKGWQLWFTENKDIFNRLFSNTPPGVISGPIDTPPMDEDFGNKKKKTREKKK
jgi:predicted  nucleic acid-binding Zn-ribbon protein